MGNFALHPRTFFIFFFNFEKYIETTRNCEGTNKLPNLKFAMLYLQNCDQ